MARLTCARAVFAVALSACGGGQVDPGFYGPVEAPEAATAHAPPGEPAPRRFARPKLVLISAAWCGACREVMPGILAGFAPFEGKVDLVTLDVTDARSTARAAQHARSEHVGEFFDRYAGRTPTVGVFVRPEEGRLVHGPLGDPDTLRRELSAALERMADAEAQGR